MTSSPYNARTAPAPVLADLVPGTLVPLLDALVGPRVGRIVRDALLVSAYALLIAVSAQLAVFLPGNPVPITGQTLAVLLGAAALGTGRATIGGAAYLMLGVAGVPWFAATSGATLGYIAGFVVAAWIVGRFARAGWLSSVVGTTIAMLAGNVAIWVLGVSVLSVVAGLGPLEAISVGVVPFLIGDAIKLAIAVALLPATQRAVERTAG